MEAGVEEEGYQATRCLAAWLNHQLSRGGGGPRGRAEDLGRDLRDGGLLLSLLEGLVPGATLAREGGELRRARLANLATVLATLQRERVPVEATADQLEAGEEGPTLALLWAVVRHYLWRAVCLGTGLSPAPGPDTLLLAWARQAPGLAHVTDLTSQWTDGSALCHLALHHGVSPTALTAALERPAARRVPTVLQTLQTQRLLPPGLLEAADLLAGRLHPHAAITGLLCLFQALRPSVTAEQVAAVPVAAEPGLAPWRSAPGWSVSLAPGDLPAAGWGRVLAELQAALQAAEDRIKAQNSLGQRHLETVWCSAVQCSAVQCSAVGVCVT
jgi:hypothetical protein